MQKLFPFAIVGKIFYVYPITLNHCNENLPDVLDVPLLESS